MKRSRPALFEGYLIENGKRRRARRDELREAWRLWAKHADIREGRVTSENAKDACVTERETQNGIVRGAGYLARGARLVMNPLDDRRQNGVESGAPVNDPAPLARPGSGNGGMNSDAAQTLSPSILTVADAARVLREAVKDKSYRAFPLGQEAGHYLRAKRKA